ncbi:MAG: hypothetical protein ACI8PW_000241 [Methylophilaceae bacterium]|jgi:hypothetical protein
MTILIRQVDSNADQPRQLNYELVVKNRVYSVYIKSDFFLEQLGLEPVLPLALLAGMSLKEPIYVDGAISSTFLQGAQNIVGLFANSFPQFSNIEITAKEIYSAIPSDSLRKAAFFSGGVDSFFTLLKGQEVLTDLIIIYGFDIGLNDIDRRNKVHEMGVEISTKMNLRLIEVESNFAKVIKDFGLWVQHGHGFALASVARALAGEIKEIRIPGTHSLAGQIPWGSWLETDPKFSDERLAIIHDACEAERIDKIKRISDMKLAQRYLRVCGDVKNDGLYNCCKCEKCVRTMTSLYALGILGNFMSFKGELSANLITNTLLIRESLKDLWSENIDLMVKNRPNDKKIINALYKQGNRPIWVAKLKTRLRKKIRHLKERPRKILSKMRALIHY